MITLSTPLLLEMSMIVLRAGMSASHPSSPNRFSEDHFLWRNSSNLWTRGGAAASHWAWAAFSACLECFDYWGVLRKTRSDPQTLWIWSSGLKESFSPRDWMSWFQVSQTSVWSTGTAPRHWWTWTPHQCADSRPSATKTGPLWYFRRKTLRLLVKRSELILRLFHTFTANCLSFTYVSL